MQVSQILADVASGNVVYVYCRPDVLDFSSADGKGELVICCQGDDEYVLQLDREIVQHIWFRLQLSIFAAGKKVFGWNLKNLFSYLRHHGGKDFKTEANLIDLKVIESYLGISQKRPGSLADAMARVRHIFNSGIWKDVQPIYKRIHLPLITQTIPAIETLGVLDKRLESVVYPHYQIDGQVNGRLKSDKSFALGFVPHTMSEDDREAILPRGLEDMFMYFDYKNMEVAVLQWLSKDKKLGEHLETPDVYAAIYEQVIGKKCEEGQREVAKNFFLPVIYGLSASGLVEKFKTKHNMVISFDAAQAIVDRINDSYGTATDWIGGSQQHAEISHVARDFYGRRREFPDDAYLVRGFKVQAPAATICLDRLIHLQRSIPVVMHIHDGYVALANKGNWQSVYKTAKGILEAESDFFQGLKLKVNCKAGRNLNRLKPIGKKG